MGSIKNINLNFFYNQKKAGICIFNVSPWQFPKCNKLTIYDTAKVRYSKRMATLALCLDYRQILCYCLASLHLTHSLGPISYVLHTQNAYDSPCVYLCSPNRRITFRNSDQWSLSLNDDMEQSLFLTTQSVRAEREERARDPSIEADRGWFTLGDVVLVCRTSVFIEWTTMKLYSRLLVLLYLWAVIIVRWER